MPTVGSSVDDIPAYHVPMQANDGSMIRLSDLIGVSPVIIFFYPKAGSSGCTKQVCHFREAYPGINQSQVKVFGVSGDSMSKQDDFVQAHGLPFLLLSDKNDRLRKGFEVKKDLFVIPGRKTFVVNTAGEIVMAYANSSPLGHVSRALEALQKLEATPENPE